MDNTGSLARADFFPWDDSVYDTLLRGQFVEWATITPAQHVTALQCLYYMVIALVTALEGLQHGGFQGFRRV